MRDLPDNKQLAAKGVRRWNKTERGDGTHLAGFVLCDFVLGVLLAGLAFAICAARLWYVDLVEEDRRQLPAFLQTYVISSRALHAWHLRGQQSAIFLSKPEVQGQIWE